MWLIPVHAATGDSEPVNITLKDYSVYLCPAEIGSATAYVSSPGVDRLSKEIPGTASSNDEF